MIPIILVKLAIQGLALGVIFRKEIVEINNFRKSRKNKNAEV